MAHKPTSVPVFVVFTRPLAQRDLEEVVAGVQGTAYCFLGNYRSTPDSSSPVEGNHLEQEAAIAYVPSGKLDALRRDPEVERLYGGNISGRTTSRYSPNIQEGISVWNRYHQTINAGR